MADVLMPRLSDTMAEGVLSHWLKKQGDPVRKGDVLAEIETDKATMELEAYDDGILERLLVPDGATVPIGQPIAVIGDGTGTVAAEPAAATAEPAPAAEPAQAAEPAPAAAADRATPKPASPVLAAASASGLIRTSPLARAIAREHDIDMATIIGTGPEGRIVRADVEAAVVGRRPGGCDKRPRPPPTPPRQLGRRAEPDDQQIPLTAVRRVTAQRLTESAAAPHFYLTNVVDALRLLAFRAEVNERLASTGLKISVTDLLVRACAVTLRAHPQINSSWGGDKIMRHRRIHVGVAVALDDGLIVPVIRDADRSSVGEIATAARELAERARGPVGPRGIHRRHLHDQQPRHVRRRRVHRDHQPA